MATIELTLHDAPTSPLNLRFGHVYAPRVPSTVFTGYVAHEHRPDVFVVTGVQPDGNPVTLFTGALLEAYGRLATYLGMASEAAHGA